MKQTQITHGYDRWDFNLFRSCERLNITFRGICFWITTQIAKFMGPTWGPSGSFRPQMGPMLAPWTLLSGKWPLVTFPYQFYNLSQCLWCNTVTLMHLLKPWTPDREISGYSPSLVNILNQDLNTQQWSKNYYSNDIILFKENIFVFDTNCRYLPFS